MNFINLTLKLECLAMRLVFARPDICQEQQQKASKGLCSSNQVRITTGIGRKFGIFS